jgi:hypothetical protein
VTAADGPSVRDGEVCQCGHKAERHNPEVGCFWHFADPPRRPRCCTCQQFRPAAPSEPPTEAEPEGYREAWDRWASAVEAGATVAEARPLWAEVNAALDRHEQRNSQATCAACGTSWSVAGDLPTTCLTCNKPNTEPPAETQQDDVLIAAATALYEQTLAAEHDEQVVEILARALAARPSADTETLPEGVEEIAQQVLATHQRRDIKSCSCGTWGSDHGHMGQSHGLHVLDQLRAVGLELVRR